MTVYILNTWPLSNYKKNHWRGKWAKEFKREREAIQMADSKVKCYSTCNQKNADKTIITIIFHLPTLTLISFSLLFFLRTILSSGMRLPLISQRET